VLVNTNVADFAAVATDWRYAGREHAGLVYVIITRAFGQDRSFVGAIVTSLLALHDANGLPQPAPRPSCAEPDCCKLPQ
jgi:hypothetical protein